MRLSEAIRLGSMMRHQAFGYYFSQGGSCAIGAACEAEGVTDRGKFEARHRHLFKHPCPQCGLIPDTERTYSAGFINTVVHLHDDHHWTREQIADWVETIELQQADPAVQNPADRGADACPRATGCLHSEFANV